MTALMKEFEFEGSGVRMHLTEGEPWFVLSDVCRILEHGNPSRAASRLDDDEKGITTSNTLGGSQEVITINESGLYSLILTSRKDAAKRFKRWVTHDVLPTLRKHGVYRMQENDPDLPSLADGKVFGIRVAKVNAAANMISLVNRIYGPDAARALYESEPGLPPLMGKSVAAVTGTAEDDPVGCLKHLLRMACGNGQSVGQVLKAVIDDAPGSTSLPALGIALDPVGAKGRIAVASAHPFIDAAFKGTQWEDGWSIALMQLDDAKAGRASYAGKILPATLIPRRVFSGLI